MSDAVVNGLAGAGGGMVAQIITYPLQTVNTRQQTERKLKAEGIKNLTGGSTAQPTLSAGTLHQIYQVIREEGWGGLYSGLMPSMVGTAASQGVYYYFYQIFRTRAEATALRHEKRGTGDGSVGMFSSLLSAAFAGCLNVLLTNPIWVVVTRMQTQAQAQKKILEAKGSLKESNSHDIKTFRVDSATKNKLAVPEKLREHDFKGIQPYKTGHAVCV